MLTPETIAQWLQAGIACQHVDVDGDGQHFSAVIVSERFAGLSRVARQQMINAVLKPRFDSGELHALSMRTLTPEEWRRG